MTAQVKGAEPPVLVEYGRIALVKVGNWLYTQTKVEYGVNTGGFNPVLAANGSYLLLPWRGMEEDNGLLCRRVSDRAHAVCVLAGDDSRIYWKYRTLADGTVVVLDEKGTYYHVMADPDSGLAVKRLLGTATTPSEEAYIDLRVRELGEEAVRREEERRRQEWLRQVEARKRRLKGLRGAVPFQMGNRWGLRLGERIVVPPLYRQVLPPVGVYCVFEQFPQRWGVLALDGGVVIEPKYQEVVIGRGRRVWLTLPNGVRSEVRLDEAGEVC